MRSFSLKTVLCASFCAWAVIVLATCVLEPVDLTNFLESDDVREIIAQGTPKVRLTEKNDNFTAGNGEITFPPGYYVVEEWEGEWSKDSWDKTSPAGPPQFVRQDGTRTTVLGEIGISGRITGLKNFYWYRVTEAKPLDWRAALHDPYPPMPDSRPSELLTISGGTISLPGPKYRYWLQLIPGVGNLDSYSIVKILGGNISPVSQTLSMIALESYISVTDYIFARIDNNRIVPENFYVLTSIIEEAPTGPKDITVNVTLAGDEGSGLTLQSNTATISRAVLLATGGYVTITLDTSGIDGVITDTGFKLHGEVYSSVLKIEYGGTPNIDNLLVEGATLEITAVVTVGGRTYSRVFTLTIIP